MSKVKERTISAGRKKLGNACPAVKCDGAAISSAVTSRECTGVRPVTGNRHCNAVCLERLARIYGKIAINNH